VKERLAGEQTMQQHSKQRLGRVLVGVLFGAAVLAPVPGRGFQASARQLFNGKDLTNFYTWLVGDHLEDPDRVFAVVDAVDGAPAIRVSGKKYGAFVTREEFSNYRIVAEYRWGPSTWGGRKDRSRDSGMLVHCTGPDGNTGRDFNGPWMLSQEFQIIEGGTGDFIPVGGHDKDGNRIVPKLTATVSKNPKGEWNFDPNGAEREFPGGRINWYGRDPEWRDVIGFRGPQDVESTFGRWTRIEAVVDGDTITNYVNGKLVNKGTRSSLTHGKILFQSEGAEIFFRKIELTPLSK
jgi:hypothetical protein